MLIAPPALSLYHTCSVRSFSVGKLEQNKQQTTKLTVVLTACSIKHYRRQRESNRIWLLSRIAPPQEDLCAAIGVGNGELALGTDTYGRHATWNRANRFIRPRLSRWMWGYLNMLLHRALTHTYTHMQTRSARAKRTCRSPMANGHEHHTTVFLFA